MYPEDQKFTIDILADEDVGLGVEQALDNWLLKCVLMHPYVENFKTIHFLNKYRAA